jgi:hypothetical protein
MFLPVPMMDELSETVIFRDGKMIPLLQNPEILINNEPVVVKHNFFTSPPFIFSVLLILILILAMLIKNMKLIRIIDIIIFLVFSVLSLLMIFFNFFTDHLQTHWNLNIIWLNPFIIVCMIMLILNKASTFWFRLVFILSACFLLLNFILPQEFEISFFLLAALLMIRSSVRADYSWNPLTLPPAP